MSYEKKVHNLSYTVNKCQNNFKHATNSNTKFVQVSNNAIQNSKATKLFVVVK